MVPMPLLVGISATPQRFNDLLSTATNRVRWPTMVDPQDVRESGLIKDEIVLWHTRTDGKSEWALLGQAAKKLSEYEKAWRGFCRRESRDLIRPILVVQVMDGSGKTVTRTNLASVLSQIEVTQPHLSVHPL